MVDKSPEHRYERAIALRYEGDELPQVVATGRDQVAREIIRRAEESGVPLFEDPELSALLANLDLGDHIPDTLFRAVAEVLSYALYVSGKHEDVLQRARRTARQREESHDPERGADTSNPTKDSKENKDG